VLFRSVVHAGARCTDFLCCFIFVVCIGAMCALAVFGAIHGNSQVLQRFVNGRDSHGRLCGVDGPVKDFRDVFFTLPVRSDPVMEASGELRPGIKNELKAVCTKKCPQSTSATAERQNSTAREGDLCPPDDTSAGLCAWYGGNTTELGFYCVDLVLFTESSEAGHWLQDLKVASWRLAVLPLIAVVLGFLYLVFVQRLGATCIWLSLVVSAVVPIFLGWVFFHEAGIKESGGQTMNQIFDRIDVKDLRYVAYGLWILSGLIGLLACCCCGTIKGIIAVLKITTEFLMDVPSQFVQPLFVGLAQLVFLAGWTLLFVQVASIGIIEGDQQTCIQAGDIYCLKWDTTSQRWGLLFLVFMLYWVENFLHALSHYGTSYAVGAWYFASVDIVTGRRKIAEGGSSSFSHMRGCSEIPSWERCQFAKLRWFRRSCCDCTLSIKAFCHGLTRHAGSLAFGAFAVALCRVLQLFLWWAKKKDEVVGNPVTQCIWRIVNCLADCFTRFVEFVSEHAYVEVALRGLGFCAAARKSLSMAALSPGMFGLVGNVACAVRVLGVLSVVAGTEYVGCIILWWFPPEGLAYPTAPLIVVGVAAFIVAEVMMHPISAAARAALHCYAIDEEEAQNSGVGSNRAPQSLVWLAEDNRHVDLGADAHRRWCCSR